MNLTTPNASESHVLMNLTKLERKLLGNSILGHQKQLPFPWSLRYTRD